VTLAVAWVTVSSLATAGTTLVLAFATFASVRSANRSARAAERSLLAGLLPMLIPSRPDDPPQKVGFVDDRWFSVAGGRGVVEIAGEAIYLAMAIRNVGNGIACCTPGTSTPTAARRRPSTPPWRTSTG
jgi:hypothetical protein